MKWFFQSDTSCPGFPSLSFSLSPFCFFPRGHVRLHENKLLRSVFASCTHLTEALLGIFPLLLLFLFSFHYYIVYFCFRSFSRILLLPVFHLASVSHVVQPSHVIGAFLALLSGILLITSTTSSSSPSHSASPLLFSFVRPSIRMRVFGMWTAFWYCSLVHGIPFVLWPALIA